jgi:hypothetical protein
LYKRVQVILLTIIPLPHQFCAIVSFLGLIVPFFLF